MRAFFIGSSQVNHVIKIYEKCGWDCVAFLKNGNRLKRYCVNLLNLFKADTVYMIGVFNVCNYFPYKIAKLFHKKIVIHWIGTDVDRFVHDIAGNPEDINEHCVNLSGSQLLQTELRSVGIESKIIPIVPTDYAFEPLPAAEEHAVISYIPIGREDYYGLPLLLDVAKRLPQLPFYVVANDGNNGYEKLDNVHYLGKLDSNEMKSLYQRSSILFRYPKHDGLSMMILEALGLGRTVIYKYNFPFVFTPSNPNLDAIVAEFEKVIKNEPAVNYEAVNFINTEFSEERQLALYRDAGIV